MSKRSIRYLSTLAGFALGLLLLSGEAAAQTIAAADLQIQGSGLRVITVSVNTGVDIPVSIQTEFAGKQNDAAPMIPGLMAVGELTGPGLDAPIRFQTSPGHSFQLAGLPLKGSYYFQNIRLMNGDVFLQSAFPSIVTITVTDVISTSVKVRLLTPEEIRARGISLDLTNYQVYEYTFSFLLNDGQTVEVPFPVIIDTRTHQTRPPISEDPYSLPPDNLPLPPRWSPPATVPFELYEPEPSFPVPGAPPPPAGNSGSRRAIPAALIIPNQFAVLHQFFSVMLSVHNDAAEGSNVRLDSIAASLTTPPELRTVKTTPSVTSGLAVPILDDRTGAGFLAAQADGTAEWVMEGLQPGTHTVDLDIRATLQTPGQPDVPLHGTARASVRVQDPRFNVTFSHPDTTRKGVEYSTFSFITNLSGIPQTIRVGNAVPLCAQSPAANVCRVDGPDFNDLTLDTGETKSILYHLRAGVTGNVFATAGSIDSSNITAAVQLTMGISESGIPLSPATLILPYYARYLDASFVDANMGLLGLGYSVATSPLTQTTAKLPRVIQADVFERAVDIARAGQRVFLGAEPLDPWANLLLDLLGNARELREWDELRRTEDAGRSAGLTLARQLENAAIATGADLSSIAERFAALTAHRSPYLFASLSGPAAAGVARPYALSIRGTSSGAIADVPNDTAAGQLRQLPFADILGVSAKDGSRQGEIAVDGRWTEDLDLVIASSVNGPMELDVVFPASTGAAALIAHFEFSGVVGSLFYVPVTRGATSLRLLDSAGAVTATATAAPVDPVALAIIGARQDLHRDEHGRDVSVLFSRPVTIATGEDLLGKFAATIDFQFDGIDYHGARTISSAALQEDGRIVNLTFDHALSKNVPDNPPSRYAITTSALTDPLTNGSVTFTNPTTPLLDSNQPAGILFGRVLEGDNSPVVDAEVQVISGGVVQYDRTGSDGAFVFESVVRDPDANLSGAYSLIATGKTGRRTSLDGAVRQTGRVQFVNLVFLGRGRAEGIVRYDDGAVAAGVNVTVGSTMFNQLRQTVTDAQGFYSVDDLPAGPLTFSATDAFGNVTFASSEIRTAGEVIRQDLSILRKPFPAVGTIRGVVIRSDSGAAAGFARVGVYREGFGLREATADSSGRFAFDNVPAGLIRIMVADFSISSETAVLDLDLAADESRDVSLTLNVTSTVPTALLEGDVLREDSLAPGDQSRYQKVSGAIVAIDRGGNTVADGEGHYSFASVPVSFSGRTVRAWDPSTGRSATTSVLSLNPASPNSLPIVIPSSYGTGTIRVKLLSSGGAPVSGYRVIEPGFPPTVLAATDNGVYELQNVPVGRSSTIWAVPAGSGSQFGDQFVNGTASIAFAGQVASLVLRLPGQGTVRAGLKADIDLIGDVDLSYQVWDEAEQSTFPKHVTRSTSENGVAGFATFTAVPALQPYSVSSTHPLYGYASASGQLGFDGDAQSLTLQLNKLSSVSGTVYQIDGVTPVAGAAVSLTDGAQNFGTQTTTDEGNFSFQNVAAGHSFGLIATTSQNAIFRTGFADGSTPPTGGPVADVSVVMRRQGRVEGRVVFGNLKSDPNDSTKTIPDDTPADLSDNAPVPLARFYVKELGFPSRDFGTPSDPLVADSAGRFSIGNLFEGPLRASASDPTNSDLRGDWTGTLTTEGQQITAYVAIASAGFGPVTITVVDPNNGNAPVENAEVTLVRAGAAYDLTSSNGLGVARFPDVPSGTYTASAYSKSAGRSGTTSPFEVVDGAGATQTVVLQFSGGVDGRLVDPQAAAAGVPGALVSLTASSFETRASTDAAGAFSFSGVREGAFSLSARDPVSNRRATAAASLSISNPRPFVNLELEPAQTLYASVFLPDDAGGNSGVLAPSVQINVSQLCTIISFQTVCQQTRELQGNEFRIPGMLEREPYRVDVHEIGGAGRTVGLSSAFPHGSSLEPLQLVLPAFGSVRVTVTQGGVAAANAHVTVSGGGRTKEAFTDGSGTVNVVDIPLGAVSAQAVSVDGGLNGAAGGTLSSQSVPAALSIELGSYLTLTGSVEAEDSGPSAGTRVIANFGLVLEAVTTSAGRFSFAGIPVPAGGTAVTLTYLGEDGVSIGAQQVVNVGASARTLEAPPVKLDSTAPRVLSVTPVDGSSNVAPDSSVLILFSEAIRPDQINGGTLQVVPADGGPAVNAILSTVIRADGTELVTMTPPAPPPGQRFPLRSNTLYRVMVSAQIADLSGHPLLAAAGASFITSDYIEPRVVKVIPPLDTPLQPATTFEFQFSKAIDPGPWQSGGAGVFHFYKLDAFGSAGNIVAEKTGRVFAGNDNLSLFFAPDDPLEPESFYRVVFSGIRDGSGNSLETQTFHFFSRDTTRPFVVLISPVGVSLPLISGTQYTLGVDLRNGTAAGTSAVDVARVDYYRVEGGTATFLSAATVAPFAYKFVAPDLPDGASLTIRAIATDLSLNVSDPSEMTWAVVDDGAPRAVSIVLTPATETYPGKRVHVRVRIEDEGLLVSVQTNLAATQSDGSAYQTSESAEVRRNATSDPWPDAEFDFDLPPGLKAGSAALFTARATDSGGASSGIVSAQLAILEDALPPALTILSPAEGSSFQEGAGNTIAVRVTAIDAEVGVKSVTAQLQGSAPVTMTPINATDFSVDLPVPFVEGTDPVPATLTIAASDYVPHVALKSITVALQPLIDPNAPVVKWLCGSDGAMAPAGYAIPLRVSAIGNSASNAANSVQAIEFLVDGIPGSIASTAIPGAPDQYQGSFTVPSNAAPGLEFTIHARATNVSGITDESVATITVVAGRTISNDTTISPTDLSYDNQALIVRGGTATIDGPHTFTDFVVLDGANVTHSPTQITSVRRLDISAENIYVSCAATIDATGRGFADALGGVGRTWPGAFTGGSASGVGGSHGGQGGSGGGFTYGSLFDPDAPGAAGGSADCTNCNSGGGVVFLNAGRLVLEGSIRADGSGSAFGAGAGGSVNVRAGALSGRGQIHADGGRGLHPEGFTFHGSGGGGGRVAVRFDSSSFSSGNVTASGGDDSEGNPARRGAAGTVYLKSSAAPHGTLVISNPFDSSMATALVMVGPQVADSVVTNSVHAAASYVGPDHLRGLRLVFENDRSRSWPIVANDSDTLTVDTSSGALTAAAGQQFRGLDEFDAVVLRSAHVVTNDYLQSDSAIDKDTASTLVSANLGPPAVDLSKITLVGDVSAYSVIGAAGAVLDSDLPLIITARNNRTGAAWPATAAGDGSFVLPVIGEGGDVIAIKAADSHAYPMETAFLDVGAIPSNNGAPVLLPERISISGKLILGTAGAVADPDVPIVLTARNDRTGSLYVIEANADGSFALAVDGETGDAISLVSRDSNPLPLESARIVVGALALDQGTLQLNSSAWTSDPQFRARRVVTAGDLIAISSYPDETGGASGDVVLLDSTDPAHPTLIRTVSLPATVYSLAIHGAWVFAATNYGGSGASAGGLFVIPATDGTVVHPTLPEHRAIDAMLVAGDRLYIASNGGVAVFDSRDPQNLRLLGSINGLLQDGLNFTSLQLVASRYIVAVSPGQSGGRGHDVVVVDALDEANLRAVADLDVSAFDAVDAAVSGNLIYLGSQTQGELTVVDLSVPSVPSVAGRTPLAGPPNAVTLIANDAFAAAGASGLATLDLKSPPGVAVAGYTSLQGSAKDVALGVNYALVADEIGLAVVPVRTAPIIDSSLITVNRSGANGVVVGAPKAIRGINPIRLTLTNPATSSSVSEVPVLADGSFTASIPASGGDELTVEATDSSGKRAGPVSVGRVPLGATVSTPFDSAILGSGFSARAMASEGNDLIVADTAWSDQQSSPDRLLYFDISDPSRPVLKRSIAVPSDIYTIGLKGGWALIGNSYGLSTIDLHDPSSVLRVPPDSGDLFLDGAILVQGDFVLTSPGTEYDGRIRLYDISNPTSPRFLKDQSGFSRGIYTQLIPYGTDYLLALDPDEHWGGDLDLVVFDRRDLAHLQKVGQLSIPLFSAFRGAVAGNVLYAAGLDGKLAVIDLSDPANPRLRNLIETPGKTPRAVLPEPGTLWIADAEAGLTRMSISDPLNPVVSGSQLLDASAWDVTTDGRALYVAHEVALTAIREIELQPELAPGLIAVTATSGATVTGRAGAALGAAPLNTELRNLASGAVGNGPVAADGSFSVVVPTIDGERLQLTLIDGNGLRGPPLDPGPFTSRTPIPISGAADSIFGMRAIERSGTTLITSDESFPNTAGSDKLLLYDASGPMPTLLRDIGVGNGSIADVRAERGWAFIADDGFSTVNLGSGSALSTALGSAGSAVAVDGDIAFIAGFDGDLSVFNVANPAAPVRIRSYASGTSPLGRALIEQLLPLGTNYLVALSRQAVYRPVADRAIILDRHDPNAITSVAELSLPGLLEPRGATQGTTLYLIDQNTAELVVVDLTVPAAPVILGRITLPANGQEMVVDGTTLKIACGFAGLVTVDVSNPALPRILSVAGTGGFAWDVTSNADGEFVVNGKGMVFVSDPSSPTVDVSRITLQALSSTNVLVSGQTQSIAGRFPISAAVTNSVSGASASAEVSADGSFAVTIAGAAGNSLTLTAVDRGGLSSGTFAIGSVPQFGSALTILPGSISLAKFAAGLVTVTGGPGSITGTGTILAAITNQTASRSVNGLSVAPDGSFTGSVAALTGATIAVSAANAAETAGPVVVGTAPPDPFVAVDITAAISDPAFRGRRLTSSGDRLLVSGYDDGSSGASDKILMFDVTDPGRPTYTGTIATAHGTVNDVVAANGWAFAGSNALTSFALNQASPVVHVADVGGFAETALALSGTLLFSAALAPETTQLQVWDVTEPQSARLITSSAIYLSTVRLTDLMAYGDDYLVALSPSIDSSGEHDVSVIDRRDSNDNWVSASLAIPGIDSFRGVIDGTTLYIAGKDGRFATVDLSDPGAPRLLGVINTASVARGIALAGSWSALAESGGVETFDTTLISSPRATAMDPAAEAWDVAVHRGTMYVATDRQLRAYTSLAPPIIDREQIVVGRTGDTTTISGNAFAITGDSPTVVAVQSSRSASTATTSVSAGGAFTTQLEAERGENILLSAFGVDGRTNSQRIGAVPFATNTSTAPISSDEVDGDENFLARRVEANDRHVVVSGGFDYFAANGSGRLLLFEVPDATAAAAPRVLTALADGSSITDIALSGDWVFAAGKGIWTADVSQADPTPVVSASSDRVSALALAGNHLFSALSDGQIGEYDISALPTLIELGTQSVAPGYTFEDLLVLGSDFLVGLSPGAVDEVGQDVTLIDRRALPALSVVSRLDIPNFEAINGFISGTTLYATGDYYDYPNAVAIVDLSDPAAPRFVRIVPLPGAGTGIAVTAQNELVVADGSSGLTFLDAADRLNPIVLGNQKTSGNAVDVKVLGNYIFVATEEHLFTLMRP